MKLVIFDLDQTLVEVMLIHDESTRRVFQRFFGVDARLTEVDFAGRSLGENFVALGWLKGISEEQVRPRLDEMLAAYDAAFVEIMPPNGSPYVLPGVLPLLDSLTRTDVLLMLYTGDSRLVAEAILHSAGLGKHFRAGYYGTEVKARADMVTLAVKRAKELSGRDFRGTDIVIIGDSLRDIECGLQFGACTITVGTGYHTREQQQAAGADFLFRDLADTKAVLEAIFS